jgi:hypothetical protein
MNPVAWRAIQVAHDFAVSASGRHDEAHGMIDYIGVFLALLVVAVVIALCIRYFLNHGEHEPGHIKRRVLDEPIPAGSGQGHRGVTRENQ